MGNQNYHSAPEPQTWEKLELIFFAGLTHSLTSQMHSLTGGHMTGHMHFLISHLVGHMHSLTGYMFDHIQSITGHMISHMLVSHLPSLVHTHSFTCHSYSHASHMQHPRDQSAYLVLGTPAYSATSQLKDARIFLPFGPS